jgi:hypothetical protein
MPEERVAARIPALTCRVCRYEGEPGAGFIPGPDGSTEQVGFFCIRCGDMIPVSSEWSDPAFREAVLGSLNPFCDFLPDEEGRRALATDPWPKAPGTIETAREFVRIRLDEGVQCPCCGQHAQRYYRTLNSGMARWLIVLGKLTALKDEWASTAQVIQHAARLQSFGSSLGSGESPSLLPCWGLIESQPNDDPKKKASGLWRPTERGRAFAAGMITVPKTAVVYNNKLERLEGVMITIKEALGSKFSYEDLMKAGVT